MDGEYSFKPVWKPPFITELASEDRCHLNGLAVEEGKPRYVTALGATNTMQGWREKKLTGGMLMDVETGVMQFVENDPDGEVDFAGATFHPDTDEMLATYYVGDRARVYPKTDEAARIWEGLRKALPDGEISVNSTTNDMMTEQMMRVRIPSFRPSRFNLF